MRANVPAAGGQIPPDLPRVSRSKIGFGWRPVVLRVSGGVHVFVDQAVEDGFSADPFDAGVGCGDEGSTAFAVGDTLRDALVRPSRRLSRVPLNFDDGPVITRPRSRSHHDIRL